MSAQRKVVVDLGLLDGEVCGDWDHERASVRDESGAKIGFVELNDGREIVVWIAEPRRSEEVERFATELLGLLRPWEFQPADVRAACTRLTVALAARGAESPPPEGA